MFPSKGKLAMPGMGLTGLMGFFIEARFLKNDESDDRIAGELKRKTENFRKMKEENRGMKEDGNEDNVEGGKMKGEPIGDALS